MNDYQYFKNHEKSYGSFWGYWQWRNESVEQALQEYKIIILNLQLIERGVRRGFLFNFCFSKEMSIEYGHPPLKSLLLEWKHIGFNHWIVVSINTTSDLEWNPYDKKCEERLGQQLSYLYPGLKGEKNTFVVKYFIQLENEKLCLWSERIPNSNQISHDPLPKVEKRVNDIKSIHPDVCVYYSLTQNPGWY